MKNFFKTMQEGIAQLVFPSVCLCCGQQITPNRDLVCDFCLHKRFEDADPDNTGSSGRAVLPEKVVGQHALWNFDKGGMLQYLMHQLKYERLTAVGTQLGEVLGRRMQAHPGVERKLKTADAILLPVPLHYLKFRKRGFNQAFYIARGVEHAWEIPICPIDAVVRKKFTLSQTGFSLQERIKNMQDAFRVRKAEYISGKMVIVIDDVFTTGSTSFELARILKSAGAASIMIWTIAQA